MKISFKQKEKFTKTLLEWNKTKRLRNMPWVNEKDPYKIWLSEIILQQTRVEQGLNYYLKIVKKYPTVKHLAKANETELFKLWQGLGYYNRCQNMLTSAKIIVENHKGIFPEKYEDVISLKGIGVYTAAAICSFAYNLPYAVLDGNVFRVLSRYFGIEKNISENKGKLFFQELSQSLLDKKNPGIYNQAIMDFGATVCKPKLPDCSNCNFSKSCVAFQENTIQFFPIKNKKQALKQRFFNIIIFKLKNQYFVKKREGADVWKNLYQFYIVENEKVTLDEWKELGLNKAPKIIFEKKQKLSHQHLHIYFYKIDIMKEPVFLKNYELVSLQKLKKMPFPKVMSEVIELFL